MTRVFAVFFFAIHFTYKYTGQIWFLRYIFYSLGTTHTHTSHFLFCPVFISHTICKRIEKMKLYSTNSAVLLLLLLGQRIEK